MTRLTRLAGTTAHVWLSSIHRRGPRSSCAPNQAAREASGVGYDDRSEGQNCSQVSEDVAEAQKNANSPQREISHLSLPFARLAAFVK